MAAIDQAPVTRLLADPTAVFSDLVGRYLKLPLAQKVLFPLLVIASVAGIIFVSNWASTADYAVLYSDLEQADAGAVVERLKQQKIKYEVRGDGRTIAVSPPEVVHELRLALAGDGIPKAGKVGFEIFDGTNFGMTVFEEHMKFLRASQGELERTIGALDAVSSVRVHITKPKESNFARRNAPPTASVMLRLRPGAQLEKKQIKGIAHLVAGSVEGLSPENVSIVDVFGNLLTLKDEEEGLGAEATRLQYERQVEQGYVQRVEQMLSKILGPGRVIARVTTEIDYSQSEKEEESFDPGGRVIRSEKSVSEGSGTSQRGGVPGVVSNLTNDPNVLAPQGNGTESQNRREDVKNYEVSRAVIKSTSPRGRLTRLSVAVLVDGTYESEPVAPGEAPKPKIFRPLEPEVISQIESIVRSAVGFDSARGDSLTVENIPFYTPDASHEEEMRMAERTQMILDYLVKLFPYFVGLLFFLFLVRPIVKALLTPSDAEMDLGRLLPSGVAELEQELEQERSRARIPTPLDEPVIDLEQLEELMAENSRIVKENPQQAALLIRYWLNDGRL